MQPEVSEVKAFWSDAKHLMNELADRRGAAVLIAAPDLSGYLVVSGDDLLGCERAVGQWEIVESRVGS